MPYIPPHLRVPQDNQPRPIPVAPPSSSRHPHLHARGREALSPDVTIQKSADCIRRLIVLSCHVVEFERFDGETFAHLRERSLHTLKAATADDDENPSKKGLTEINELLDSLSLQECENPTRYIIRNLQKDLTEVLEKFKGFAAGTESGGRLVPFMWLRFGKLLFEARRGLLERQKRFTPKEVEINFEGGSLSRTFDTCLSEEEFTLLHDLAHKSASETRSKESFIIQFSDETRLGIHLWCVCSHSKHNEQSACPPKNPAELALDLKRVRLSSVRHMICDLACVGKTRDIRILFFTKENCTLLTEEELLDLKSCYSKASIDFSVKGGLRWPLGSKLSASGRFGVVGSWHKRETLVFNGGLRWSFTKYDRMEFKASTGRMSYEVDVRPSIYHEFCKGREERTLEELMLCIEDLLRRVWADCIDS